jgi:hypothetical protein
MKIFPPRWWRRALAVGALVGAAGWPGLAMPQPGPWLPAHGPDDRSTALQNPPDFRWPWVEGSGDWEFELKGSDGIVKKARSSYAGLSWPEALAPGEHEWRVRRGGGSWGAPRRFTVAADAVPFVVPGAEEQLRRAAAKPRPRYVARKPAAPSAEAAALVRRVQDGLRKPLSEVREFSESERLTDRAEFKRSKRQSKQDGQRAARLLSEVALAWHLSGDERLKSEGRRRLLEVASWDPEGASGVEGVHLVARDIVWGMALLYDAVHDELSPAERRRVVDRIVERAQGIHAEFTAGERMQRQPINSHGWVTWAGAAAAVAMVAGDDPRADALFRELVPAFVTSIAPWGGDEGGYGNGTPYGMYDVASLIVPLDMIGSAIGADLFRKAWLRNVGRFFTYFVPPGGGDAPFGNGSEALRDGNAAWVMRALATRVPDPLIRWHAAQREGAAYNVLPLMLAAVAGPLRSGALPPGQPNAAVFGDVGWAALHSEIADLRRVSVYFKSSPYGSQNHSHADQNAFVVHAAGKELLKGSGYYDFYGSEHFREWYQTTRAHNAITFDGGKGQPTQRLAAAGRIVHSALSAAGDVVTGDATAAYAGQLSLAQRTIAYLRPGTIVVHDRLASDTARRWEWNFHADERITGDERSARVEVGGVSMCVDVLHAPPLRFEARSGFPVAPRSQVKKATHPDQWHAMFASAQPLREAEFVVAMRVGCAGSVPRLQREAAGWRVQAEAGGATREIRFEPGKASIR